MLYCSFPSFDIDTNNLNTEEVTEKNHEEISKTFENTVEATRDTIFTNDVLFNKKRADKIHSLSARFFTIYSPVLF